jgi:Flp pilus assembly protein TadG
MIIPLVTPPRFCRRGRDPGRGVAAVEFTLILPLFLLFVLGCIDWGYFFFVDQVVTNAAREGARAASVLDTSDSDADAIDAAETAASQYLTKSGLADRGVTASVLAAGTVVNGVALPVKSVQVVISYSVKTGTSTGSLTGYLHTWMPKAANATAVMRWQ